MPAQVIDIHAHAVLPGLYGAAGSHGPWAEPGPTPRFHSGGHVLDGVEYAGTVFTDPDLRVARMAEHGIDRQVLSPNPLYYFHHLEPAVATPFARRHNQLLAELVDERAALDGFALLPLQDPAAAAAELERAVRELGMVGAYVGTRTTRELDDPAFDDLWRTFVDLDVPLCLHPAPDAVDAPTSDPRLGRWDLDLIVGFPYDETLAVATLVYGGVLDRHPRLDVCISHGGGAAPYLYGRMAAAARSRPWSPEWLREDGRFEQLLRRLWFDCHVHDPRASHLLVDVVGRDRVVFGTNFGGWDQGHAPPSGDDLAGQMHANTARLLRLDSAAESSLRR